MSQEQLDDLPPHLDVDFVFGLTHPFPPIEALAIRLARRHRFLWNTVNWGLSPEAREYFASQLGTDEPRWRVSQSTFPTHDIKATHTVPWTCTVWIEGPTAEPVKLTGCSRCDPPTPSMSTMTRPRVAGWTSSLVGCRGYQPGRGSASSIVGEALCTYNTLREVADWLRRHDRSDR